jgi:replicative DNA helicase
LAELEDRWQQSAFEVSASRGHGNGLRHVKDVITDTFANIDARHNGIKAPYGVTTGFSRLDSYTTGFHEGDLIVICGRPGMGKTSFALDIAVNAVNRFSVAFFSLEMKAEQIGQRLLAKKAAVNIRRIRAGDLEQHHFDSIVNAMGDLSEYPLFIDDSEDPTPAQIRFRVRQISVQSKEPIGLVIVDYLQIMTPGRKQDPREQQIASISREM